MKISYAMNELMIYLYWFWIKRIALGVNKKKIELEITTDCNLACNQCNRSCWQAASKENMSLKQIKKFVKESIDNNHKWWVISLCGGEPTLHPKIFEIINIIEKYKQKFSNVRVEIVTNGYGEKVNKTLLKMPHWITHRNTSKNSSIQYHRAYNNAPIDNFSEYNTKKFKLGCDITQNCGLGLTRYGYYCCGPGASIDRIFGFNIGIKKLSDITNKKLKYQKDILCRMCGCFDKYRDITLDRTFSKSWAEAYKNYKIIKPELSLY